MGKTVKRTVEREVFVPFEDGDTSMSELGRTIYEKTKEVETITGHIDALKERRKAPQKELDDAVESLAKGKPVRTTCTEILDYDAGTVVVNRDDTGEVIVVREMEDGDYQLQIDDEEVHCEDEGDGDGEGNNEEN